ncbi:MAG: response regulator [Fuerstiella sp.]
MTIGMKRCITDVDAANLSERARLSRLLLVEDNSSLLTTLMAILEDEGFAVTGCATATEALVHIQRQEYGIAVVDLKLPDMQGTQLLKKFRDLGSKVRVIINTAYGGFESAKDAVNSGAFGYLEKGTDPSELVREVHRANRSHFERYAEDLEAAVAERTKELSKSEVRLRLIIENPPVGLLHEDFSAVEKRIDALREEGVEDIREYLENNADAVKECVDLVKILDVNPAALQLHEASNKNELIESLARTFCEESYRTFRDELIALADGRTAFESDAVVQTLSGEKKDVMLRMFVDVNSPNWSSSYIAVTDITERKLAEAEVRDAVR